MSNGAPADRSWAVPVIGFLAVAVGVVVLGGGLFLLGSTGTCACSPSPPPHTATADQVQAQGSIHGGPNGTVSVGFDHNRNAAALLVVFEQGNGTGAFTPTRPDGSPAPTAAGTTTGAETTTVEGTTTVGGTTTGAATATPDAANVTFANGSVTVVEAEGDVRATDRGLWLVVEDSHVRLSVEGDVTIHVVALPHADSDFEPRVVATWNGTAEELQVQDSP